MYNHGNPKVPGTKTHLANGPWKKKVGTLFSLLNMESPKVQKVIAIGQVRTS